MDYSDGEIENTEPPLGLEPLEKKPKKKKKKVRPLIQARVKIVHDRTEKIPPAVAYFPNGFDRPTNFKVFRNTNMPKRLQLVVGPNDNNNNDDDDDGDGDGCSGVDYVGTSYSGVATAGQKCVYAVGVFDNQTQSLKIAPIAANKVFRLDPRVRGVEYSYKESENSTAVDLTAEERRDKVREATNIFGTKSSIKKAKKYQALRQEGDLESQKLLDVKLKNIVVNQQALESVEAHSSRNIPPHDISATTPEQAYPLEKIIPHVEWDHLEDIYNLLRQNEEDFKGYPSFVCNRIEKLKKIEDESEKRKVCCIFSYINHLIKYKEQHSIDGSSSAKAHKIPNIVRHKFSSMFSGPESRWLPTEKLHLLIRYILVLTLLSDQFHTSYKDIAHDLKMRVELVKEHYQSLGCKIIRGEKFKSYATLPVPLEFPVLKQRYKRKRT